MKKLTTVLNHTSAGGLFGDIEYISTLQRILYFDSFEDVTLSLSFFKICLDSNLKTEGKHFNSENIEDFGKFQRWNYAKVDKVPFKPFSSKN